MTRVSVAEAKAGFSGLVDEAAKGEFVTITRHGKPAAVLVSIEAANVAISAMKNTRPNFGDFLLSYPGGFDIERDSSKMGEAEFE